MMKLSVPDQTRWGKVIKNVGLLNSIYRIPEVPMAKAIGTPITKRTIKAKNINDSSITDLLQVQADPIQNLLYTLFAGREDQ